MSAFTSAATTITTTTTYKDYEKSCYSPGEKIYINLIALFQEKPELYAITEPTIFYFMNGNTGFGSQLTQFMQNLYVVQCVIKNPNIICLPYFYKNESNFRYFDESSPEINTFFKYFSYKNNLSGENVQRYFIMTKVVPPVQFFEYTTPPISNTVNRMYIEHFNKQFEFRLKEEPMGVDVKQKMDNLRTSDNCPIFGIQIRSMAQKMQHSSGYANVSILERLRRLKSTLDLQHKSYKVFLASDTNLYIKIAKDIFGEGDTYFLPFISRIDGEQDSIPLLQQISGYKLGTDILLDCYALALCDAIYVSNSNVPFIINTLNSDAVMIEY